PRASPSPKQFSRRAWLTTVPRNFSYPVLLLDGDSARVAFCEVRRIEVYYINNNQLRPPRCDVGIRCMTALPPKAEVPRDLAMSQKCATSGRGARLGCRPVVSI